MRARPRRHVASVLPNPRRSTWTPASPSSSRRSAPPRPLERAAAARAARDARPERTPASARPHAHRALRASVSARLTPAAQDDDRHVARRVSSPQTVGRTDTLAALDDALAQVAAGAARLVLLAGEAGIGKTRMARELADRARSAASACCGASASRCRPASCPTRRIVAALRPRRSRTGVTLEGLLTELREGRGGAPPRRRCPRSCSSCCCARSAGSPRRRRRCSSIEDIHWADAATQDLVRFLARNLREERLLILVDAAHGRAGAAGAAARPARRARPQRPRRAARARAADGRGHRAPGRGHRGRGRRRGAGRVGPRARRGQPVLRRGAARGARSPASRGRSRSRCATCCSPAWRASTARRAGGPRRGRRRPRHRPRAARARGRPGRDDARRRPPGAGRRPRARRATRPPSATASGTRWRARRSTRSCCRRERRALHAAIARALEAAVPERDRGAAEWAALAQHWDGAHEEEAALRASVAAAAAAHDVYAFRGGARPTSSAPARCGSGSSRRRVPPGSTRSSCCDDSPTRRGFAGDREAAIPIAEAALALVDAGAEPERAASIHIQLGVLHRSRERAMQQLERALELLPPGPVARAAAAMAWIGKHLIYGELPSDTRAFALEALEVARAAGARDRGGHRERDARRRVRLRRRSPSNGLAHYREADPHRPRDRPRRAAGRRDQQPAATRWRCSDGSTRRSRSSRPATRRSARSGWPSRRAWCCR